MSPSEHALGPSMCERAQAEPSIEVRAEVFVRIEPDRAGGDRIRQAQTPKPHRGQRREVGIDDEIDVEALIGETQIDGRRLDAQPEGTTRSPEGEADDGLSAPDRLDLHSTTDEPHE